jgi:hypothetical protein
MNGAFARIALRYLAGILVTRGLLSASDSDFITTDPDISMLVEAGAGLAIGAAVEGWYWLAKRFGWRT